MYPISVAAEQSGVMIETIRYYEREGIVPKPDRTGSGRRVYSNDDISRLRFVKRCRDLGFAIPDAKSLLELAVGSQNSCAVAGAIAQDHLNDVKAKIEALRSMEEALIEMTEQCSVGSRKCTVLDRLLSD